MLEIAVRKLRAGRWHSRTLPCVCRARVRARGGGNCGAAASLPDLWPPPYPLTSDMAEAQLDIHGLVGSHRHDARPPPVGLTL